MTKNHFVGTYKFNKKWDQGRSASWIGVERVKVPGDQPAPKDEADFISGTSFGQYLAAGGVVNSNEIRAVWRTREQHPGWRMASFNSLEFISLVTGERLNG